MHQKKGYIHKTMILWAAALFFCFIPAITYSANQPPVLNSIGNKTVYEGQSLSFGISGYDPQDPNATLIYSMTRLYDEKYDINNDGAVNLADVYKVYSVIGAKQGETRYIPKADIDNNGIILLSDVYIVYSKGLTPVQGASFNPDTHIFSWNTTVGQAGVYHTTFSISRPSMLPEDRASETITITVKEVPFIYPQTGGEVVSPDGRAKLIIPPDALYEPTKVSLMLLDPTTLQNATPQDYALKVVVDCRPPRLIFKKPCQLFITFDEPEVPGTPIELGLLDEETQQIVFIEERAPILSDGISIQFPITHFSTYAGLSSLLSQGAPIGAGVKIPLPDMLTGSFGHSIPITVPPGRKGMQPNLTLQYRSSNPNSFCGLGWSINPGYIIRSTKLGPPAYDDTKDTFIFVTDSGSTEMVHLIDNLYQAKIESSFAKFFKETDDSWKVVQKDGATLRFGQTTDSKETSASGTFLWNLTKVTDNNANFIELNYTKDQNKTYLYYIEYTGNENTQTPPKNRIDFILEDRTDVSSNYIFGSEVKTAKRLSQIQVKQQNGLVWRYEFTYGYSQDTKRSLLTSITQYSSDGAALPTQTFTYQGAND